MKDGQVVVSTSADGSAVTDRPVTVVDLLSTIYTILGVNYRQERRIPAVDLQTQANPKALIELL